MKKEEKKERKKDGKEKKAHTSTGEKVLDTLKHLVPHPHHHHHHQETTTSSSASALVTSDTDPRPIPEVKITPAPKKPAAKASAKHKKTPEHKSHKPSKAKHDKSGHILHTRHKLKASGSASKESSTLEAQILSLNDKPPTPPSPPSISTPALLSAIHNEVVIVSAPSPERKETPLVAKNWIQHLWQGFEAFLARYIPNNSFFKTFFNQHVAAPHHEITQQAIDTLGNVLSAIQNKKPAVNEALISAGRVLRFTKQSAPKDPTSIQTIEDRSKPPTSPQRH